MKGKVKWYNRVKGYGFLVPEDGSPEVFVHHSAVQAKGKDKVLVEGQGVEFEVTAGPKGPSAANVKPEPKPAPAS
ncbi:MAG: cold-shock protein [Elusimicrobia bacterium]|jgi:CspA family cold shock protein|nr:cold-shock protein [Elusimicrobiota bacterium]MBK7207147.1 cold-shock protein [Elusimicrobiota bacterium]MBK7545953.1 cold-shock protein [Elusimicrobiota bacterium]MBK7574829.1 cold-shock protein [Elusimicrobiota bacterium]MBK7687520.1 cold-shock protein [Elusimicrobiota bacterium]